MPSDCYKVLCTKFGVDSSAVFLLERGQTHRQTDKQTDATERPATLAWVLTATTEMILRKENDVRLCVQTYTLCPGRDAAACIPCTDLRLHSHHQLPNPVPLPQGSRASGSYSSATESDPRTSCSLTNTMGHFIFPLKLSFKLGFRLKSKLDC